MTDEKQGTAVTVARQEQAIEGGRMLKMAEGREERVRVWETMDAVRQGRIIREASETIAEFSWGAKLAPLARTALARFAYAMGTDPVRHWLVLGNTVYDRVELWLDLVTSEPDYHHHDILHVNDDDRLSADKRKLRAELRAEWNLPDTKGACIVTIYVKRHGEVIPFQGANHAGNRKCYVAVQKREGIKEDPVGEQDPGKTAESRAWRRAAKKAYPLWRFKRDIPSDEGLNVNELARDDVSGMIAHERAEAKRLQSSNAHLDGRRELIDVAGAGGMKMVSTEGDRVSALKNTYDDPEHKPIETIEGVGQTGTAEPYPDAADAEREAAEERRIRQEEIDLQG